MPSFFLDDINNCLEESVDRKGSRRLNFFYPTIRRPHHSCRFNLRKLLRRLRHLIQFSESIKQPVQERNGRLLQHVWIVTRQPSTVTVFLRTHVHNNLSHSLFIVPSPIWTYIIDEPPFLPPCTLRPRHMHNTFETLGSLGPKFGVPFPRLFYSCPLPARKTPTYLKFWT